MPMHAVTITPGSTGAEALTWSELAAPSPAADEVVIQVIAAGVNRADLLQRQGNYPPPPGASAILGLECSGTITAVGSAVSGWQIGDRCVALLAGGGYAEQVAVPAGQVIAPPPGIDPVAAGGIVEVAATVVSNLDLAHLTAGETFLVHGGSGGIGSFAIQWANHLGATVVTTAGSADKVAICGELGADHVLRYDQDWQSAVGELGGVDVILDPIGAKYLKAHLTLLRRGGRLVTIGMQGGRIGELDFAALLARNASVTATGLRGRPVAEKSAICARLVEAVWPLLETGQIRLPRTTVIEMTEAARAHILLDSGDSVGKVVLRVPSHG